MKNKTTLILAGLLVVMAGIYFLVIDDDNNSTLNTNESSFAISDTSKVREIKLSLEIDREQRRSISLSRTNEGWRLNGEYGVVPQQMKILLKTLKNIEVRAPVHPNAKANYLEDLRRRQIRVDIDSQVEADNKTFFVGGSTPDKKGTIMLLKGAEAPYIVEEPGIDATLFPRFLPEFDTYQEKIIFNIQKNSMQSVGVEYLGADSSFTLIRKDPESKWLLQGSPSAEVPINNYLKAYNGKVYALAYADAQFPGVRDSLARFDPDATLRIRQFDGSTTELKLFARQDNINEYWGWRTDEQRLMRIQKAVINRFLPPKQYFLPLKGPYGNNNNDTPQS